eukprot:scaffold2873_cov55-Phaeocystis_antarctica.AAC.3
MFGGDFGCPRDVSYLRFRLRLGVVHVCWRLSGQPAGQLTADLVRCVLVELRLDLLTAKEEQPETAAQDRVSGELVLGRATLHERSDFRQAAPQSVEAFDAGAGREGAAKEDHEEVGHRGDGLHDLQRQRRVESEADEGKREAGLVKEQRNPHIGVIGHGRVEHGDQAAPSERDDDD